LDVIKKINGHIYDKRKPVRFFKDILERKGFIIEKIIRKKFFMRFIDGSAFLNHYVIRFAFLDSWKNVIKDNERTKIFTLLEEKLNEFSKFENELKLTIPFVCIICKKC
jgi:hypothetical protein